MTETPEQNDAGVAGSRTQRLDLQDAINIEIKLMSKDRLLEVLRLARRLMAEQVEISHK